MPSTPTEAKTVPLARFMGQVAYGADLQRIIEDLCGNRDIRPPETSARHHYEMAVKHRASLLSLIEDMAKALGEANEALDAEPEYHHSGMGCGLEDRSIHDRYAAMEHGWDTALERSFDEQIDPAKSILASALSRYTEFLRALSAQEGSK